MLNAYTSNETRSIPRAAAPSRPARLEDNDVDTRPLEADEELGPAAGHLPKPSAGTLVGADQEAGILAGTFDERHDCEGWGPAAGHSARSATMGSDAAARRAGR